MKKLFTLFIIFSLTFLYSCEDSDDIIEPDYDSKVEVYAQMTDPNVSSISNNNEVDSIHVDEIQMLFSTLHFISNGYNRIFEDDPMVFVALDSEVPHLIETSMVPEATYQKVKFNIHRFTDDEINTYGNNELYDFFTTGDRYSYIIEGKVYKNGQETKFVHSGRINNSVTVEIETPIYFDITNNTEVIIEVLPDLIFIEDGHLIDPTNVNNFSTINLNIQGAFKAYKSYMTD